jgi:hypothetical protein
MDRSRHAREPARFKRSKPSTTSTARVSLVLKGVTKLQFPPVFLVCQLSDVKAKGELTWHDR